ncbi:MAG TPA: DEAD/DEAH box helicase, partial [Spirochaetota bacterium]|nr:DEAD/DEAH box helicase [Spirochaetota bacterium]
DVKNLTHVINYSPSQDFETYVHRSGRTGRAGELGKSISFLSHGELRLLPKLERLVGKKFVRMDIPTPEEIILSKSGRLTDKIKKAIEANSYSKFTKMASTLLESDSAETVVAALLQTFCGNELDKTKYAAIDESSSYERGRSQGSGEFRGRRDYEGGKKKFDSSSRRFGRDDRPKSSKDDRPKYNREDRPKFERDDRPRKETSSGGGRSFGKKPSFGKKKSFKKDV